MNDRSKAIIGRFRSGETAKSIADSYGITPQAVHDTIKRNAPNSLRRVLNTETKTSLIGARFGRLTIVSIVLRHDGIATNYANLTCDCGHQFARRISELKRGRLKSCGCRSKEGVVAVKNCAIGKPKIETYSKFKGVSFDVRTNQWVARVGFKTAPLNLGRFRNELEAAKAYDRALTALFGDVAMTNKKLGLYGSPHTASE